MAIVKLNFSGHDNVHLTEQDFTTHKLHVDLADPELCQKVAQYLAPMIKSGDTVTVALPGLAPLAAIILTTIHGLCGQFPTMQPLVRQPDGEFVPVASTDLQAFRNNLVRANLRDGVVVL